MFGQARHGGLRLLRSDLHRRPSHLDKWRTRRDEFRMRREPCRTAVRIYNREAPGSRWLVRLHQSAPRQKSPIIFDHLHSSTSHTKPSPPRRAEKTRREHPSWNLSITFPLTGIPCSFAGLWWPAVAKGCSQINIVQISKLPSAKRNDLFNTNLQHGLYLYRRRRSFGVPPLV